MFAVRIDVSNDRSTVAVLQSKAKVTLKPFEVAHAAEIRNRLAGTLHGLGDDVRIVMEHTGRYYEFVAQFLHGAGFFVSALNLLLLRQYTSMDAIRYQLKTLNQQYQLASKNRTTCANNLLALLEQNFPGIRSLLDSPVRNDGSQKWIDLSIPSGIWTVLPDSI